MASLWHRDQNRKYPNVAIPYASHVAGVAAILARHGFSETVVAAGALHDTIEDCGIHFDEISARFGREVAELVRHCSEEDKSLEWAARKAAYLEKFPHKPWEAQAITLADKIDNLLSIVVCASDHGDPWPMFKKGRDAQLERYDALEVLAQTLRPHPLIQEYSVVLQQVRDLP